MKKLVWLLAALLLLSGCSGSRAPELRDSVRASFDTAVVRRGDVAIRQVFNASVTYEFVPQSAAVAGTVERIYVAIGDEVTEGQLLAEIGTSALEARRARTAAELTSKQASGALELQLLEDDLKINAARRNLAGADTELLALEGRELQAERDYLAASLELEQAQGQRELERLDQQIAQSRVYAAADGMITTLELRTGRAIRAGAEMLRIAKSGSEYLLCTESDSSVARTTARCTAHLGDRDYDLTLIPYTTAEYMAAQTAGTVPARFAFPEGTPLQAGQGAQLTVYAREAEDVLYLPQGAVYGSDTSRHGYVYKMVDGEKVYTEVTVTFRTASWAVIEDGLEEGDVVYVPS